MSTPKPCPFCGHKPYVGPRFPEKEGNAWGYVQCQNPECPTYDHGGGVTVRDGADVCDERGSKAYKQLAIARWNQRPRKPV